MLVSAVTGDVGAGKSTLTACWRRAGASVIDADAIVREAWRRPEIVSGAVSLWGEGILDERGAVLPGRVADRAFVDAVEYRRLCDLVHPAVMDEMERMAAALDGWVVAEIPLLFEVGVPWWVDATVYVSAPAERRVERNSARGWTEGEIARRESFLLPAEEKRRLATYEVDNGGTVEEMVSRAESLAALFRRASRLVRCAVAFDGEEGLRRYLDLLEDGRLAARPLVVRGETACGPLLQLSFFTLESLFPMLAAGVAARGPCIERVRRLRWEERLEMLGELRT